MGALIHLVGHCSMPFILLYHCLISVLCYLKAKCPNLEYDSPSILAVVILLDPDYRSFSLLIYV